MLSLSNSFGRWYRSQSVSVAVLAGSLLLALLLSLDALLGFDPAIRTLYVLPLWLATRMSGRGAGWVLVFLTSAVGVLGAMAERNLQTASAVLGSAALHLGTLGLVMLAIASIEEAIWRLRHQALHDPLTGLLNTRALKDFGKDALRTASSARQPLTVVMIDCDGFKEVNDRFGHAAGDHVLRILARVLESETRQTDLVARLGGDEFALVLAGSDEAEAQGVMARVERAFEQGVRDAGYDSSISVGMAGLERSDLSFDTLLGRADQKMYATKKAKRAYLN